MSEYAFRQTIVTLDSVTGLESWKAKNKRKHQQQHRQGWRYSTKANWKQPHSGEHLWSLMRTLWFKINLAWETLSSAWDSEFFISWKSFQSDEEWHLFYCNSIPGCRVGQDLVLCKPEDMWCHNMDTKWWKISKVYRFEILRDWCATRTTHCNSGYDATIATYLLPDLFLPKMKKWLICCSRV